MTGVIATIPRIQFSNALGLPLAGGKLTTYLAGTTTLEPTYQDQALTTANETTITLDSTGSCSLWLDPAKNYKFLLKNSLGVTQPGWPVDNISGSSSLTSLGPTLAQYAKRSALADGSGSELVGYRAAAANAQTMWLREALDESVSVSKFMTPNQRNNVFGRVGTMNVTAAILAAIAALGPNGGEVLFPPGVYLTDNIPINGKPNVHLRGANSSGSWTTSTLGTTIKATSPEKDVFSFSNYSYNCTVEGLHITGGKRALHFDTCLGWHVFNVNLRENQIGFEAFGNGVGVIRDSMIRDNTVNGIYLARQSGDTDLCNLDVGNNKINLLISTGGVRVFGGSYFSSHYEGQGVGIQIDTTTASHDDVIRNVNVYGSLIANNAHQVIIKGTSLAQRDIQDVKFHGCHIHQADDGGQGFNPAFAWGYGAYIINAGVGIRFVDCDFIGCRDFAVKAINCMDGVAIRGGSIRYGNADAIVFDLVQWGRVAKVDFIGNGGTALKMICQNAGDWNQNNRFDDCNYRSGGAFYSEDARTRANLHGDHMGPTLGDYVLNTVAPLTQIRSVAQAGNQLSLKNQNLYLDGVAGTGWSTGRLSMQSGHIWIDVAGKLRIKNGSPPVSDTDGELVRDQV